MRERLGTLLPGRGDGLPLPLLRQPKAIPQPLAGESRLSFGTVIDVGMNAAGTVLTACEGAFWVVDPKRRRSRRSRRSLFDLSYRRASLRLMRLLR